MAGREARHAKEPPTKEIFVHPLGGTELYQSGFHTGYRINDDAEHAYLELYVPHDFTKLLELKLVLIAEATATPMTVQLDADWAKEGEPFNMHGRDNLVISFNTVNSQMYEIDISKLVDIENLEAKDCLGLDVNRVATQNTNMTVLGLKLRYE